MKESRDYFYTIKRHDFSKILQYLIFRRSPLRDRDSIRATKVLRIKSFFKKKKCFIELPFEGGFPIVNRHFTLTH